MPFHGDTRKLDLAKIHLAKAQLGMAEDTYRGLLATIGRVDSAADLDDAGRKALLAHFKRLGWAPRQPKREKTFLAKSPRGRLLLVLWGELYKKGRVDDGSEAALISYILNHTKLDRIEWLTGNQFNDMIEQLKKWVAR